MAVSKFSITEGSGKDIATYSNTEGTVKEWQRVVLNDSTGTEVTSFGLNAGTEEIGTVTTKIGSTIFTQSAAMSSTAQLTAGSTFTSTVVDVISNKAVLPMVMVDQPVTITIYQYIDAAGTQLIDTTVFTRIANAGFNEAIQINGNYVKLSVQNTGSSSTNNLVIDTWIGDMPPFPKSLTSSGNFKVEIPPKQTYKASTIIPLVAAVTVNVPFFNIIGSATKTITVKRISVNGFTTTAVGYVTINAEKLSTATSGGTSTTLVATPLDSSNSAATAVVKAYTVAPTKGTLVGVVSSQRFLSQANTAAAAGIPTAFEFLYGVMDSTQGITLRGAAQELCLVFPVVLASAGTCAIDIEWTEE